MHPTNPGSTDSRRYAVQDLPGKSLATLVELLSQDIPSLATYHF